ncbi:hypothetical protein PsYK624_081870 [Phanerochaete sordida]|uniref:Protein kinase domain-containing protein n=1 Tax=Phanerochaete sordida TaxID=48140 RepID=A0A9P3LEX1_9APHY|nr:hypothetical protein PsYK624_081870 [Phanerochaete sordida]
MSSTDKYFVGAMPPGEFFEAFVTPRSGCAAIPSADFSTLSAARTVREISESIIRAVAKARICPSLRLFTTKVKKRNLGAQKVIPAHLRDKHRSMSENPLDEHDSEMEYMRRGSTDGCDKPQTSAPLQHKKADLCPPLAARTQSASKSRAKRKRDTDEYHDFATATLGFEVLRSLDEDPFCDTEDPGIPTSPLLRHAAPPENSPRNPSTDSPKSSTFTRATPEAAATRSRLVAYAQATFARQQRCFLFQIVVIRDEARFIRWDRSGAIVTRRFSVIDHPHLTEFLWRFDHMSDLQRGRDSSATLASRRELKLFEDAMSKFLRSNSSGVRKIPDADRSLDTTDTYPTWKIRVANQATGESTALVTRRPFAGHRDMFGRSTRAYLALDLRTSRLVFLKDSWRADNPRLRPEFRTYQELRAHDVPFIPYPAYGGDVHSADGSMHETTCHLLSKKRSSWRITHIRLEGFIHHRLVQDIAYPLETIQDERELMQACHDALIALDRAYRELGIIHRDISSMNVMLTHDGKCVLSDWDHAGTLDQKARGVGTFQFMSARLVDPQSKGINERVDDLESLFWVLLWIAILRFGVGWCDKDLHFFRDPGPNDPFDAGMRKTDHLLSRGYRGRFRSKAFAMFLRDMASTWATYNLALPSNDPEEASEPRLTSPENTQKLELMKEPSFWAEKIMSGIRAYDAEQAAAGRNPRQHPLDPDSHPIMPDQDRSPQNCPAVAPLNVPASVIAGRKRKTPPEETADDHPGGGTREAEGADLPRRSKRLKAARKACSC